MRAQPTQRRAARTAVVASADRKAAAGFTAAALAAAVLLNAPLAHADLVRAGGCFAARFWLWVRSSRAQQQQAVAEERQKRGAGMQPWEASVYSQQPSACCSRSVELARISGWSWDGGGAWMRLFHAGMAAVPAQPHSAQWAANRSSNRQKQLMTCRPARPPEP